MKKLILIIAIVFSGTLMQSQDLYYPLWGIVTFFSMYLGFIPLIMLNKKVKEKENFDLLDSNAAI